MKFAVGTAAMAGSVRRRSIPPSMFCCFSTPAGSGCTGFETGMPTFLVETLFTRKVTALSRGQGGRGRLAVRLRRRGDVHRSLAVPDRLPDDQRRGRLERRDRISPGVSEPRYPVRPEPELAAGHDASGTVDAYVPPPHGRRNEVGERMPCGGASFSGHVNARRARCRPGHGHLIKSPPPSLPSECATGSQTSTGHPSPHLRHARSWVRPPSPEQYPDKRLTMRA